MDNERLAAILARHERDSARYAVSGLSFGEFRKRAREARTDRAELLASYKQIAQERDEARANNARSICIFCGTITPFDLNASQEDRVLAMWTHAEGCAERPEKRLAAAIDRLRKALIVPMAWAGEEADRVGDYGRFWREWLVTARKALAVDGGRVKSSGTAEPSKP